MIGQRVRCCCDAAFEEPMVKARSQHLSQNEDVRYLGRLLGDVIRAYGGEELFRRTEYIRRASVDRHRGISGADAVDTGLDRLSLDDTLSFVRGFMLFSMLANLAEDRHSRASQHWPRSEEHTSELQSLMRISYAGFSLKKKKRNNI